MVKLAECVGPKKGTSKNLKQSRPTNLKNIGVPRRKLAQAQRNDRMASVFGAFFLTAVSRDASPKFYASARARIRLPRKRVFEQAPRHGVVLFPSRVIVYRYDRNNRSSEFARVRKKIYLVFQNISSERQSQSSNKNELNSNFKRRSFFSDRSDDE